MIEGNSTDSQRKQRRKAHVHSVLPNVGDLMRVIHDGSTGLVVEIHKQLGQISAITLHTGESFKLAALEVVVNESR